MSRRHVVLALLAAALLGLGSVGPASAAPTGCTTTTEWVHEGSSHYYGRGKVTCTTGRYTVKLQCRNQQTGVGYVRYGGSAVDAPSTATATCLSGNVAEQVQAAEDPRPTTVAGCVTWMEWVHSGSTHYYGRGRAQCDGGTYRAQIQCHDLQSGRTYLAYGTTVTAPATSTGLCRSGNVAGTVTAAPR
ncbi:hypothetical protein JQN72_11590 [Phycicoccus sp. CSK15P-2]|uniref:hypothetical protein n=1 Tax=Phycicoccus sp. CSK15P-2 TaxID=2807627 RepID=UPI00194F9002|nr:hypothetical protein [Phycicoccus sp. CSK15P-2]MBM6404884.1 hypothetical protein [Phycicoccus sp. CSK15P-2]